MTYRLHMPTTGFVRFSLFRRAYEDEVTVQIGEATYELDSAEELRAWLQEIGWSKAGRLVDLVWNFRRIECDLAQKRFRIPKQQNHPDDEDFGSLLEECPLETQVLFGMGGPRYGQRRTG